MLNEELVRKAQDKADQNPGSLACRISFLLSLCRSYACLHQPDKVRQFEQQLSHVLEAG